VLFEFVFAMLSFSLSTFSLSTFIINRLTNLERLTDLFDVTLFMLIEFMISMFAQTLLLLLESTSLLFLLVSLVVDFENDLRSVLDVIFALIDANVSASFLFLKSIFFQILRIFFDSVADVVN
jgi:hypothetical protein